MSEPQERNSLYYNKDSMNVLYLDLHKRKVLLMPQVLHELCTAASKFLISPPDACSWLLDSFRGVFL